MLRSVFTTRRDRLAVAYGGGKVLDAGVDSCSGVKVFDLSHDGKESDAIDLAYSADTSTLVTATEDKHVRVSRTGGLLEGQTEEERDEERRGVTGRYIGSREVPKKPTSVLFAPCHGGGGGQDKKEVLVVADKCGDAYAAPLPDPSVALKHLLGHTAMTITSMVSLKEGTLLATADRAEHIRVSEFPRTSIIHTYLLGHKDFVSVLAVVPGEEAFLISGGGDGMVGLWDAEAGEGLSMISVRQACQDLADADADATAGDLDGDNNDNNNNNDDETAMMPSSAELPTERAAGDEEEDGAGRGKEDAGEAAEKGQEEGIGGGGGGEEVAGDGVPISVSCSEDGKTVAVVVSGLEGLLLLNLTRDGGDGGGGKRASLFPRARLQLPTVPIQAGFLAGDLVVAMPSSSSTDCMQAFGLADGREGAIRTHSSQASLVCAAINAQALQSGYVLKPAVPDDEASEALGGALRKHKGTRNAGKSPSGWNNFSKRRDKKQDKKRKRLVTPRPTVV